METERFIILFSRWHSLCQRSIRHSQGSILMVFKKKQKTACTKIYKTLAKWTRISHRWWMLFYTDHPFTTHWTSQFLFRDQVYIYNRETKPSGVVRLSDPDPDAPSEPGWPSGKDLAGDRINLWKWDASLITAETKALKPGGVWQQQGGGGSPRVADRSTGCEEAADSSALILFFLFTLTTFFLLIFPSVK